ncbi:MAG: chemotaxis response regulator protein-glutamate methylesterase [Fuerstiella sp.]|jgi:two-component system chemotaxis response regulator CheB|nr:chemotaxis response regulator protein-glutamate methylesterase [Fuerstiella sp.]
MKQIRLLVVDDSSFIRRVLTRLLSEDPKLNVVATAANGQVALSKIEQIDPDVVLLDIEMPIMNGLETLRELRTNHARLPVIMFSTLTHPGVRETVDALLLGANDYATKPDGQNDVEHAIRRVLIPKIKMHAAKYLASTGRARSRPAVDSVAKIPTVAVQSPPVEARSARPETDRCPPATRPHHAAKAEIIVIASSTGGPNALARLFSQLPEDLPVPILIVQHMPALFIQPLAFRLSSQGNVIVRGAENNGAPKAGEGLIAPGGKHMTIDRVRGKVCVTLNDDPPVNSCKPAADVLFESVAEVYGAASLAVVLTGMGEDGRNGCRAIKGAGGQVLVQDEDSSVVWGMPGSVTKAALADAVYPLDKMGPEIVQRISGMSREAGFER